MNINHYRFRTFIFPVCIIFVESIIDVQDNCFRRSGACALFWRYLGYRLRFYFFVRVSVIASVSASARSKIIEN